MPTPICMQSGKEEELYSERYVHSYACVQYKGREQLQVCSFSFSLLSFAYVPVYLLRVYVVVWTNGVGLLNCSLNLNMSSLASPSLALDSLTILEFKNFSRPFFDNSRQQATGINKNQSSL